jgi:hypothetical protein
VIVENAFLKLPELLIIRDYDRFRDTFEATIVHLLASAVLMELNSRNVPRPFEYVHVEKPYRIPKRRDGSPIRADLFVDLKGAVPRITDGPLAHYGARAENWIEVKAFLSSARRGSTPTKTNNAGKILRDLLRLCVLPGGNLCGRYLLIVFSGDPSRSIALQRENRQQREWLYHLLAEGYTDNLTVDLAEEPRGLIRAIGPGFIQSPELQLSLKLRTMMFEPKGIESPEGNKPSSPFFWGYLVRIRYFQITIGDLDIQFGDEPGQVRSPDTDQFGVLQHEILSRMKG